MNLTGKVLRDVFRRNLTGGILWLVFTAADWAIFTLYGLETEAFFYSAAIALLFLLGFVACDLLREKVRAEKRAAAVSAVRADWRELPEAANAAEADYQEMIRVLGTRLEELTARCGKEKQDALDYYTAWVHQIKTPISVMKLKLAEDTGENRALSAELFRLEQYVDMALQYIRLGSETNDLVIREYDPDGLVKEALRKFAPLFVEKKLSLRYSSTAKTIVTDKKWFLCILEQLLSNAVKYTPAGTITVSLTDTSLIIADTGIGIAPEDLPRIFEKGYTGLNGRIGEKSSGLGLYLAKKAASVLSIPLSAESEPGKGSRFILDLRQPRER